MSIVKKVMEGHFDQPPTLLSMEEIDEMQQNAEAGDVQTVKDLDEAEHALDVVSSLEDLAFVASKIEEVSPKEAALIQIAADASMIGTGVDSSTIFPSMEDIGSGKDIADRIKEIVRRIVEEVSVLMKKIRQQIADYLNVNLQLARQYKLQIKELRKLAEKTNLLTGSVKIHVKPLYNVDEDGQYALVNSAEMLTQTRRHVKDVGAYITHASLTLENVGELVKNYFDAVVNSNVDKQVHLVSSSSDKKLIDWFSSFSNVVGKVDGYDVGDLLMGLRLSANISDSKQAVTYESTAAQIASSFRQNINDFSLTSSIRAEALDFMQINALNSREIQEMLNLADEAIDQCLDKNKSLMSEFSIRNELFDNITKSIMNLGRSSTNILAEYNSSVLTHLSIASDIARKLARMPRQAFQAPIVANLRLVNSINKIVHASINVHSSSKT